MNPLNENVRIVLVGTTHPGNIGATARAMKTMSQNNLYLVNPKIYPSAEATARATGADDVLINAKVCANLKSAVSDCDLIVGTSARVRSIPWPLVTPRECANNIATNRYSSIAIIFGRENSGLSNEELELCNLVIKIPTNLEYSSLNLAAAVQIICYELLLINESQNLKDESKELLNVNQEKMELFYKHIEECMIETGFYDLNNPGRLMHRLRRLFNRAHLDEIELNILRGFLSSVQSKYKK